MTTQATCEQCGRNVDAGAAFCAFCGSNVSAAQSGLATRQMAPGSTAQIHVQMEQQLRNATAGEYEILTELGRGGMATVYLGHDLQLTRKVAIKVMLPTLLEGEGMAERFQLEARTAAALSHPHIIPIYAVREGEDLLYFVMKFIEGRPLDSINRELGPAPVRLAQSIISKVADALGYAHRRGVVHRDIKPANLMIDVEGLPVVTDFGIAKVQDTRGLTMTGATVGTPHYMSPEQCMAGKITGASDQYSLGVVAYEMMTGHLPFQGDSIVSLLYKHVHEPPPPFAEQRPDCPLALHDAIMRMLAKSPENRFPTMETAVEAIGAVSLAFDDPLRTQLMAMAKKGVNLEILKRVSTPRSPTPVRSATMKKTGVPRKPTIEDAAATIRTTPTPALTTGAPAPPKSRGLLWGGIGVAIVAVGIALWLRPWQRAVLPPVAEVSARIARLAIEPSSGVLDVGSSMQLAVAARDSVGQPATAPVTWTSADPTVASVSPNGQVTAIAPGVARILATAGGAQNIAQFTVAAPLPAPVAGTTAGPATRIQVQGAPPSLPAGGTAQLRGIPVDACGAAAADRSVTWSTSAASVASVSRNGLVTAVAPGSVVITARSGSVTQTVSMQVVAPAAVPPPAPVAAAPTPTPNPPPAAIPAPAPPSAAPQAAPEPAPPPAAVDPREAVAAVIQDYARALESHQVSEVRRVYPSMTADQENAISQMRGLDQLRVPLRISSLEIQGDVANAAVVGEYVFYSRENRRNERLPVRFQATLERGPSGWRIRSIR